jgi:hypothetical protein
MDNAKKVELEGYLLQGQNMVDGWSTTERRAGIDNLEHQLTQKGILIDDEVRKVMEKFASGDCGFEELSRIFLEKFSHKWDSF